MAQSRCESQDYHPAQPLSRGCLAGLVESIELSMIVPPRIAIRGLDGGIAQLAESIAKNGLLQPIVVRPKSECLFELVAGNRRLHACKYLRWRKIPCNVIELDDKEAYELSLVENVQRKSMDPVMEAQAYHRYITDYGWGSARELATKIGKSSSYISRRISILELPPEVLELVRCREISPTIAEELAPLRGNKNMQSQLATMIAARNLSLRRVRGLVSEEFGERKRNILPPTSLLVERQQRQREAEVAVAKATTAIRLALNAIGSIIEETDESNWTLREMLMNERSILHGRVDAMIRQRKRLRYLHSRHRNAFNPN